MTLLLALLATLALVAVSCGEDEEEAAPPPPPPAEPAPEPPPPPEPAPEPPPPPEPAAPAGPEVGKASPRIAQLHPDAVNAAAWYRNGFAAFEKMAAILDTEPTVLEHISYDQAPQTLRQLAEEGFDIIVPHSSGYEAAVLEVAPDFPETWFIIYSDLSTTNDLPNVAGWAVHWNQVGYMAAAIGCAASDVKSVGMVVSAPIPAYTRWTGGSDQLSEDAADVLGYDCEFNDVWTGDFLDAAKAKQAAQALIDGGADVLFDGADAAGVGAVEAAVQNGVWYVGAVADQCEQAPDTMLISVTLNFDIAYEQMGEFYSDGSLEPAIYSMNLANTGIDVSPPCNANADVDAAIDTVIDGVSSGDIVVDPTREKTP
jgi:basic membrane protein A